MGGLREDGPEMIRGFCWEVGAGGGMGCGAQKLNRDKTAVESHLLLQIIVGQIPATTIRVQPAVEMDLVQVRGDDLLARVHVSPCTQTVGSSQLVRRSATA